MAACGNTPADVSLCGFLLYGVVLFYFTGCDTWGVWFMLCCCSAPLVMVPEFDCFLYDLPSFAWGDGVLLVFLLLWPYVVPIFWGAVGHTFTASYLPLSLTMLNWFAVIGLASFWRWMAGSCNPPLGFILVLFFVFEFNAALLFCHFGTDLDFLFSVLFFFSLCLGLFLFGSGVFIFGVYGPVCLLYLFIYADLLGVFMGWIFCLLLLGFPFLVGCCPVPFSTGSADRWVIVASHIYEDW